MDDANQECKHQHLHGQAYRLKPDRRQPDVRPVEKCGCYHIDRIPEKASEHKAPERGGNTAVHEHLHELPHPVFHVLILGQTVCGACNHDEPVSRIRQHQPKKHIVEARHHHGRVNLALARKAVALNDSLHGLCKLVVAQHHGHVVLFFRFGKFNYHLILILKQLFKRGGRLHGNISRDKEYPSGLYQTI